MTTVLMLLLAQPPDPEVDVEQFPSMEVVEQQIDHWNRHLYWLGVMKGGAADRSQYTAWQQETNLIMVAWEQLKIARGGGWITNRETALINLRTLIGAANYDIGKMPMIDATLHREARPMVQRPPPPQGMAPPRMPPPCKTQ